MEAHRQAGQREDLRQPGGIEFALDDDGRGEREALAGALLVPEEFEGAWLEGGSAWFRIGGATLGPVEVPHGADPGTARAWLTGELARQVPGARVELAGFRIAGAGSTSISRPKSY
jgi:hypothetical protein